MTFNTVMTAIIWGTLAGVLAIHLLANLLALLFCLHGLLKTRWKRLVKKAAPGLVRYSTILPLMLRIGLYSLLFALLLQFGDSYVRRQFWFEYRGSAATLFFAVVTISALCFLPKVVARLRVVWKMSHQIDYAQRRQRTRMLKR